MDEEEKMLKRPDFRKRGREDTQVQVQKLTKNAAKKARRLARAKENRQNVDAAKIKTTVVPNKDVVTQPDVQDQVHVQDQVPVQTTIQHPIVKPPTQDIPYSAIAASGTRSGRHLVVSCFLMA